MRAHVLAIAVIITVAACDRSDGPQESTSREHVTFSDSAGVRIAFNSMAALDQAPVWHVDTVPDLELGGPLAPPELELLAIVGVRSMRRGIAVVSGGALRLFADDGTVTHTIYGTGEEEPFERPVTLLTLARDSLLVFDFGQRRLNVFSAGGAVGRVAQVDGSPTARLLSVFDDGSLLMIDEVFDVGPGSFEPAFTRFARHSATGELIQSLPQQEFGLVGMLGEGDARFVTMPVFAPRPAHVGGRTAYWVVSGRPSIARYSPDGQLTAVYRWDAGDLGISADEIEMWRRDVVRSAPSQVRAQREALVGQVPVSDQFPATRRTAVDHRDRLWVEVYSRPGQQGPATWLIFADDGAVVARAQLPSRFTPHEIGPDYVLGVEPNVVGIEAVRRYRLRS